MFDSVDERLGNLDVRRAFVFTIHERPGSECEVARLEQAIVELVRLVVILYLIKFFLAHAPRRGRVVMQVLETLLLR